jgi:alkylhydroperoxidase family enzyme
MGTFLISAPPVVLIVGGHMVPSPALTAAFHRATTRTALLGFTEAQIAELRRGQASFDARLDALGRFARAVAQHRGHVSAETNDAFLAAGWTQVNLVDTIMIVGDKTISNYLHCVTKIPVDFPAAEKLAA